MHFPLSFCKNASPTFSMVHLLHRLYGVDAPAWLYCIFSRARAQVEPADRFSRFMVHMTCFRPKTVIFWVATIVVYWWVIEFSVCLNATTWKRWRFFILYSSAKLTMLICWNLLLAPPPKRRSTCIVNMYAKCTVCVYFWVRYLWSVMLIIRYIVYRVLSLSVNPMLRRGLQGRLLHINDGANAPWKK